MMTSVLTRMFLCKHSIVPKVSKLARSYALQNLGTITCMGPLKCYITQLGVSDFPEKVLQRCKVQCY